MDGGVHHALLLALLLAPRISFHQLQCLRGGQEVLRGVLGNGRLNPMVALLQQFLAGLSVVDEIGFLLVRLLFSICAAVGQLPRSCLLAAHGAEREPSIVLVEN